MSSLDSSQTAVVNVPISERQVVIAAPGSGKTFTAVELIKRIDKTLPSPEENEVVYISFSNAAIRAATEDSGTALHEIDLIVDAGTLDSFANAIVNEQGLSFDSSPDFFEERVKAAVDIVRNGATSYFDETVHVIIDEAQDIYGARKQLAIELIKFLPPECGITVLGDPMQSIYSFLSSTGTEPAASESSEASLLVHLIDHKGINPKRLFGQYRAKSAKITRVNERLRAIDYSSSKEKQVKLIEYALSEATIIDESTLSYWAGKWNANTAVLTRNNAEVLLLCEALANCNVSASPLFPPEQRRLFPAWITAWADHAGTRPFAPTDLHAFLQTQDPDALKDAESTGYDFHLPWEESTLSEIAAAYRRRPGHSTYSPTQTRPLISTVHQSKGRQFETVVLTNPFDLLHDDSFYGAESELAYVGITRARRTLQIFHYKFPRVRSFRAPHYRSVLSAYRRHSPKAIEIRPSDVDREAFYGEAVGQAELAKISPTAKLKFSLVRQDSPLPRYRIQLNDVTLGLTNKQFGESLAAITRTKPGSWPRLSPVMQDGTETVFGNEVVQGRPCWLVPRPFGFSDISFK